MFKKILLFAAVVALTQAVPAMALKKGVETTASAYHNRTALALEEAGVR